MNYILVLFSILIFACALFRYFTFYYIYIRTTNRNDMPSSIEFSLNPYNANIFLSLWHDFTFPIDPKYENLRKWSMMSLKLTKLLGIVFIILVCISIIINL